MSDQVSEILEAPKEFVHDGMQFMKRCQKPDQKEFLKVNNAGYAFGIESELTGDSYRSPKQLVWAVSGATQPSSPCDGLPSNVQCAKLLSQS